MSLIEPLPARPLEPRELTPLNRADVFELVIAIEDGDPTRSLLIATEGWIKTIAHGDNVGWPTVETVALDSETERTDGLQACERAILPFRNDGSEKQC